MDDKDLKTIYYGKRKSGKLPLGFSKTTFEMFKEWFEHSDFDKGCHYCHITNERSKELFDLRPQATRGGRRGKRLELDRRNPILSYDNLENLVWSCYWCNNAKTNFFTYNEFKPIGEAIGKVLKGVTKK